MIDLSSLNANQLKSVNWPDGPLLVLAGPGSGKTRVLIYRIARIIDETPGKHFRVLGLTFTNRAASEMRHRIESIVPNPGERILLTTFHSFSVDLLRQHGHHIGLSPDFTILSQTVDREGLLDDAIAMARQHDPEITYRGEQLLPLISSLLDDCVAVNDATQVLLERNINGADTLGSIYGNYRHLMIASNQLDFGGLIAAALELMEQRPAVTALLKRIYTHVCVDEFQDTNLAQYRILRNIIDRSTSNLFVVADDDQIIYQWNGADPERLDALRRDFNMSVIQLPENYRCPAEVVDIANRLISNNLTHNSDKADLVANKSPEKEGVIRVLSFDSLDSEANWVASDIALRDAALRSDCAVLARTRRVLKVVVDALGDRGIPGYMGMRKDEFLTNPMIWLHSMLRLANARQDREQLRRVCKSFFELTGINLTVGDIVSDAAAEEGDYLRAWHRSTLRRQYSDSRTGQFLAGSIPKLADRLEFRTFLTDCFAWFERLPEIGIDSGDSGLDFDEEMKTWHDLVDEVDREFGREHVTLNVLLQGLDLRSKTPKPPIDAVSCFTIHASKGLEFRHVYLVGLVEDQLPSWLAIRKGATSHELQEERRNCFVAITRAEESLALTYSREVFGWAKKASRFLKEMDLVR